MNLELFDCFVVTKGVLVKARTGNPFFGGDTPSSDEYVNSDKYEGMVLCVVGLSEPFVGVQVVFSENNEDIGDFYQIDLREVEIFPVSRGYASALSAMAQSRPEEPKGQYGFPHFLANLNSGVKNR